MRRNILLIGVLLSCAGCGLRWNPNPYSGLMLQRGLEQAGGAYSQNLETQRRIYEAYQPIQIPPYIPPVSTAPRSLNCFSYGGNTICQ